MKKKPTSDVKCHSTYFFSSYSLCLFSCLPHFLTQQVSCSLLGIYSTTGTGADHSRTLGRMESLQLVWKRNHSTWNTCISFTVAEICNIRHAPMFQALISSSKGLINVANVIKIHFKCHGTIVLLYWFINYYF